jgi:hypothetical protein
MRPLSPELIGIMITSSLTLLASVFHMGVRRERVDNIKQGLTLEIRNLRENFTQHFDRIELRLASIERQLDVMQEQRAASERWQGAIETRLDGHERSIDRIEHAEAA